jgi:transcription termination/antitermination protein NusG
MTKKFKADEPAVAGEEAGPDTLLEEGQLNQPIEEEEPALDGATGVESLAEAAEDVVEAEEAEELAVEAEEVLEEAVAEASPEEVAAAEEDAMARQGDWFVIHTYSGYENKVKTNLEHRIQSMDVADKIFQVVIPTEEEIEIREGARRTVAKKIFPGYVLVQMVMDDESWYVVRNTPGVTGFVAPGGSSGPSKPSPLATTEVKNILRRMKIAAPKVKVGFSIGESVRIIEGPFQDFVGSVDEINVEKGKVKVLVSFFGRETPVELDFLQVERI